MNNNKLSGNALVLEVNSKVIRATIMKLGSKNPKVTEGKYISLPEGAIQDGSIQEEEPLKEALSSLLKEPEYKKIKKVVFSVSSSQVISETVTIPASVKKNRMEKLLKANADMYFSVDMSQYHMVWTVLGETLDENGEAAQAVQIWAVPNIMVSKYYALANGLGLSVEAIDYSGNSLVSALGLSYNTTEAAEKGSRKKNSKGKKKEKETEEENREGAGEPGEERTLAPVAADLILLGDEEHLLLTFAQNGHVKLQRMLLRGEVPSDELNEALLVQEYFISQFPELSAGLDITLCGSLANDPEYVKQVEETFLRPCKTWTGSVPGPEWCAILGASITHLDFGIPSLNHPKNASAKTKKALSGAWQYVFVAIGGVALLGVIIVNMASQASWNSTVSDLEYTERSLSIQAAEVSDYESNYMSYLSDYVNYSNDFDLLVGTDTSASILRTYNDNLSSMLEDLEEILPTDVSVAEIAISSDGLGLQLTCPSKEDAAYLIIAMRDMDSCTLDGISDLTTTTVTSAASMVNAVEEEEEEEETTDETTDEETTDSEETEDSEDTEETDEDTEETEEAPEDGSLSDTIADWISEAISSGATTGTEIINYILDNADITSENLIDAFSSMSEEEVLELLETYSAIETTYDLSTLLKTATFEQRAAAMENMLNEDFLAMYKFFEAFQDDMIRPATQRILFPLVSGDILSDSDLITALSSGDLATILEEVPTMVSILVQDEETLSATEELLQYEEDNNDDSTLNDHYAYYLAVEMGLQSEVENIGGMDMNALLSDYLPSYSDDEDESSGSSNLEDALSDLQDAVDSSSSGSTSSGSTSSGSTSSDSSSSDTSSTDDSTDDDSTSSSSSSDAINDLLNSLLSSDTTSEDETDGGLTDEEIADALSQIDSTEASTDSGWDGNYHISVALGYSQDLIDAEMGRKGLSSLVKQNMLGVE